MIVTADDRTGALEVAGSAAHLLGRPVVMASVGGGAPTGEIAVVDLSSRHLSAVEASGRALAVADRHSTSVHLHKIDSLLRGNWAVEIAAIASRRAERVVVVPAFPAVGRTCVDGVVLDGGEPVHRLVVDPLTPATSSRAADHLLHAGFASVAPVGDPAGLVRWAQGDTAVAVCDAVTDDDVDALVGVWASLGGVVLAGPTGAIAAAVAAVLGVAPATDRPSLLPATGAAPVTVVCGSLHPRARAQVARLVAVRPDVVVVASPSPGSGTIDPGAAQAMAASLAADGRVRDAAVLVVVGGDTAAAVLGEDPVSVHGVVAPGTPWMVDGSGRTVITRAGGFGGDDALVSLLEALHGRMGP